MKFLDTLQVQWTGDGVWLLVQELRCVPDVGEQITVPAGFRTDLASIPRALWPLMQPAGRWARASVLHDCLYGERLFRRERCDQIFLEAMLDDGVNAGTARLIHRAVRIFGKQSYRRQRA